MSDRFILITGCSGGGKSTLLGELAAHGATTIPEPGRRIVAQELTGSGEALPWKNPRAFAERALAMARLDLSDAQTIPGTVFFDRGVIDAAVALRFAGGPPYQQTLGDQRPYGRLVFLAPPWREIFAQDDARQHSYRSAIKEYARIEAALTELGYEICLLPKAPVEARVAFVRDQLAQV